MDVNQLKEIFIEEASEIIEKLDVDIINFEEDPEDKELLNELFRGVHTLKGSANSFGFSRLGEFVHHFEDALDYFRNSDDEISSDNIDVFLNAVDVIKEVMEIETEGIEDLPPSYDTCLENIKKILGKDDARGAQDDNQGYVQVEDGLELDLGSEFDNDSMEDVSVDLEKLKDELVEKETLFKISLHVDDDLYFRGYDHAKLFKMLSQEGHILESYWNMKDIPNLDNLKTERAHIKDVDIYLASIKKKKEIKEVFEYLEDYEYEIEKLFTSEKEPPKTIKEEDIKFGRREEDKQPKTPVNKMRRKTDVHSFVKIDTKKLDELFDSIGELVIAQNFLAENQEIQQIKNEHVSKTINLLSKTTKLIQNRVMSLRMVPIHDTFEKMKRVVRDASKKVKKEISLVVEGAETEIDKTMIDSLSDPLIHIIRNAIDHGIEDDPNDRLELRKSSVGKVTLKAYHRGGNIAIEISDDGRGINREKVFAKAVERGLVEEGEELTDTQVFGMIMQAGFSTADQISDISGRGVGLDVVRTSIEKLKGKVEISSEVGKGSTFTILLPLTLAIIDGMLVKSEQDIFIIPTLSVLESFIPSQNVVHTIKGRGEFVDLRGEMIPILRLNEILETGDSRPPIHESTLVCIESEKGKFAILIDDLIGRQQVVIKSLGSALAKMKEISGSAVMGTGEIALILNVEELFKPEERIM